MFSFITIVKQLSEEIQDKVLRSQIEISQNEQLLVFLMSPRSSIGCIKHLRTGGRWFEPSARPILVFFPMIYNSHCDRIHSSLTAVNCFTDSNVGKQPVPWKRNIVRSTGLKNSRNVWICAPAAAIQLK